MKRVALIVMLILSLYIPVFAEEVKTVEDVQLPNIFIWAIPDDEDGGAVTTTKPDKKSKKQKENVIVEEEINLEIPDEESIVLKSTTLKGYTEYVEGADDVLYMDDYTKFVLNLVTPQQLACQRLKSEDNSLVLGSKNSYSRYKFQKDENSLIPSSKNFAYKYGNWSLGTSYDSEVTNIAQLEKTTSLYTKYETKYFSLSSKYKKNNMTLTQIQTDNFSVVPELKINSIFAIKDVVSADITRNRRSNEVILSINPLGKKDVDRMYFDIGAKQTVDINSGRTWSQLNFTTNFKL